MTSPSSSRSSARRRQRSTRLVTATVLVAVSAVVVAAAIVVAQTTVLAVAAALAVALGAAASRIVHSELTQARRAAAHDRAAQARAYTLLTAQRTAENIEFAQSMQDRIRERETTISELEVELGQAHRQAAEATRTKHAEARRANVAEAEQKVLGRSLGAAEDQAAEAIVRVAELEGELDALRAELDAWRAKNTEGQRKRA